MNKNLFIILFTFTLVILSVYIGIGKKVDFEVLSLDDAPYEVRRAIESSPNALKFSIFHDETNTYIYYKCDHLNDEYITTSVDVRSKGGNYIVNGIVGFAVNDSFLSYDQLIKLDKMSDKNITLKETNKR
ncbi:hypothetical protein DS745_03225 [Anaerobacillus alkaliphilus]|uniref:Uncharacterized protein n=1 Tax=Anaerobacillus alkaliphilus TaxID=1548597 RepID=A0A4Q0W1C2_9BACI|nr:hypothetical protein [Anaerobacillus alkaliphilus]RXJ04411.1 hypothetical protein DS745_03225 [Anaerobacillus alkaliphilus]